MRFKMNRERIKLYFGHKASGNEVIEAYHLDEVPSRAATLNQALVGRKHNNYSLFSNGSIFLLMGF